MSALWTVAAKFFATLGGFLIFSPDIWRCRDRSGEGTGLLHLSGEGGPGILGGEATLALGAAEPAGEGVAADGDAVDNACA